MNSRILEGKVITVTGAGAGIGKGAVNVLAREGAQLILADINLQAAEETAQFVQKHNIKAIPLKIDVSNEAEVQKMVDIALKEFGQLNGAFNNAGISGATAPMLEYPNETFSQVIDVDLKSIWLCMKAQIAAMLQQESKGAIMNTASVGGLVGKPGISAYIAAKHGVIGLTKNAALEYGSQGVRINAVCPGIIRTAMIDQLINSGTMGTEEEWNNIQPIGRMGTPEEIGELVAWVLSDRASLLHGQSIAMDGAFTVS